MEVLYQKSILLAVSKNLRANHIISHRSRCQNSIKSICGTFHAYCITGRRTKKENFKNSLAFQVSS